METVGRALGWLRYAVLGMFFTALLAGVFVPIYTDEVGWRFQERAGLDGVDKLFNDICGPSSLAVPPFFMMPVRYYSALFNTLFADPMYVRLSGVLYALVWSAMVLTLIAKLARGRRDRAVLTIVGLGLMCLGTLPMLLVWSRPEQPIVLATTAALLVAWIGSQAPNEASARAAWLRSFAVVALGVIALSYHLKALFVVPVFLACLFFASRGRQANLPRLIVAMAFVAIVGFSADYWVHRLQCPDDAMLRAAYALNSKGFNVTAARTPGELLAAIGGILRNVNLIDYFGLVAPRPNPLSNWLEPNQIALPAALQWFVLLILGWSAVTVLAVACVAARAPADWRARRLDPRPVLCVLLLVAVLGWSATQGYRNVYEACLVLPLVMLAIVFGLSARRLEGRIDAGVEMLAAILGLCALLSPPLIAAIYAPSIARAARQTGYLAAQPASLPVFGYASLKPDILAAARKCGIDDSGRARALLIDDLTYFAFIRSPLPQHQLGVIKMWRGSIRDPIAYLRSRGSTGAILGCHLLPDDLRAQAKRQGRFCCLSVP
jgi:hypothetical protein